MAETAKRDYYEVLGVESNASDAELKEALTRKAELFRQERDAGHPEAKARIAEAAEAYKVLADPSQRNIYDKSGHAGLAEQAAAHAKHSGSSGFDWLGVVVDIIGGILD